MLNVSNISPMRTTKLDKQLMPSHIHGRKIVTNSAYVKGDKYGACERSYD
jgi:hypothetical protein